MRRYFLLVAVFCVCALLGPVSTTSANQDCAANVVDAGLYNEELIGQFVYQQASGGWYRVEVVDIDRNPWDPPAIKWRYQDGREGWEDARSHYTEAAMNARMSGSCLPETRTCESIRMACAARLAALANGDHVTEWLMRRGCCEHRDSQFCGAYGC